MLLIILSSVIAIYAAAMLYYGIIMCKIKKTPTVDGLIKHSRMSNEISDLIKSFIKRHDIPTDKVQIDIGNNNVHKHAQMVCVPYLATAIIKIRPIILINKNKLYAVIHELVHAKQYSILHGFTTIHRYTLSAIQRHDIEMSNGNINNSLPELEAYVMTCAFMIDAIDSGKVSKKLEASFISDLKFGPVKHLLELYNETEILSNDFRTDYLTVDKYLSLVS